MNEIRNLSVKFEPVGSRITCVPAPTDTDADFLILVEPEKFNDFESFLFSKEFEFGGSRVHAGGCIVGDPESFQSYTRKESNLIVTSSPEFFDRFMAATSIAKRLNLLDKSDRIALFQAVLYARSE